jgi:ATP-dependent Clp protease ATP-binding subunit ClpA
VAVALAAVVTPGNAGPGTVIAGAAILVFALAMLLGVVLIFLDSFKIISTVRAADRREQNLARGMCPVCGYDVRANDDRCSECGEPLPEEWNQQPAQTPAIRRIIRAAVAEARTAGSDHVGTQPVLLSIVKEPDSAGAQVLSNLGITDEVIRAELIELGIARPLTAAD